VQSTLSCPQRCISALDSSARAAPSTGLQIERGLRRVPRYLTSSAATRRVYEFLPCDAGPPATERHFPPALHCTTHCRPILSTTFQGQLPGQQPRRDVVCLFLGIACAGGAVATTASVGSAQSRTIWHPSRFQILQAQQSTGEEAPGCQSGPSTPQTDPQRQRQERFQRHL
jgi:hypothetical protein